MSSLYIVIPAYNGAENIGRTIDQWYPVVERHNDEGKSRLVIINDGRVLTDNLRQAGRDDRWLAQELHRQGIARSQDVFLLSVDQQGAVVCLRKEAAR